MSSPRFFSIQQQVAERLKRDLENGRWVGEMPGRNRLVELMEVSGKTVDLALKQLEKEGYLMPQGVGKKRKIVLPSAGVKAPSLRVRILLYEKRSQGLEYYLDMKYRLEEAGHDVAFTAKSLHDLGMDVKRVASFVQQTAADAWIVCGGSRPVLEWFIDQPTPAFALFGIKSGLPIAGVSPGKIPEMVKVVRRLVDLGHRRIVMISREERRHPKAALFERAFLSELESCGIETGSYNLPDWKETPKGFHQGLDRIFAVTPPTAMFVNQAELFIPAYQHLQSMGLRIPRDVSMICDDPDRTFTWCDPEISHIRWDPLPVVKRVEQWTDNIARGKEDTRQTLTRAHFVEGGTIAPPPVA